MSKVSFTFDPFKLVRLALEMYAERIENNDTKAKKFARYKFLETLPHEELEQFLLRYVDEYNLESITLKDWQKDCECIFTYIYESDRFKELEYNYNKIGKGLTGLGVIDKTDDTFYECNLTEHWEMIIKIIKEKYPHYYKALEHFWLYQSLEEYEGITRNEIDDFIMQHFELIGEGKPLNSYIR